MDQAFTIPPVVPTITEEQMAAMLRKHYQALGRRGGMVGGKSRSQAKARAARRNAKKARKITRKNS